MRAKLSIVLSALAAMVWAVPIAGAAPLASRPDARPVARSFAIEARSVSAMPLAARFRLQKESGLLLRVWLNGSGPYIFAIDTGAGLNVITERAAADARLPFKTVRPTMMGGLTATTISSNREAVINQMALGDQANTLASPEMAVIVPSLSPGIDGILDPTEVYAPFGYSIDMSNQRIEAVDTNWPSGQNLQRAEEGAVVPWVRMGGSNRPFVRLGDGRVALIDTGSGFGLAVSDRNAVIIGNERGRGNTQSIRDIGGGTIFSRRVSPSTISIGELELRGIPTDILSQVQDDAPVILGRDALYPFKITFDPRRRLIEFVTSVENN
jgi:hypothetical protein